MSKKTKWRIGLGLLVLCYALICWPGVLLFNKPSPIILSFPPFAFVNYLMVLIIVGIMLFLYKWGVGE